MAMFDTAIDSNVRDLQFELFWQQVRPALQETFKYPRPSLSQCLGMLFVFVGIIGHGFKCQRRLSPSNSS